jgi:hypothetical protein
MKRSHGAGLDPGDRSGRLDPPWLGLAQGL